MTQAPATSAPSIPSSVAAPSVVSPSAPQAQPSYPTQTTPAYVPEAPVSVPQANPWQAAYQGLLASLSGTQPSQPQAYSSPMIPQAAPTPAAYPQASVSYQAAPSVSAPLISALPQTQAYSPATMPAYQQVATQAPAPSRDPAVDAYLENVSNESLEVLQHFGYETPALLNRYACVVEDALLTQAQQTAQALQHLQVTQNQLTNAHTVIEAAAEDNAAYHTLLTNPDLLSQYVKEFFGPNGPYPVETAQDRLAAEVAAGESQYVQAPVYQRPQLDMPAPDVQAGSPDSEFWNVFSQISDRRPDMAWQVLSQATPDALRSKILVSEA